MADHYENLPQEGGNPSTPLAGDVTGPLDATVVSSVSGASKVVNDSSVGGATVKDALNVLLAGGGGGSSVPVRWWDIKPANGKVLPVSAPRAYYPAVLYSATPAFNDGTNLRKYVAYYGAGTAPKFSCAAFSDDGITWNNEQQLSGVVGDAYHASTIVVAGVIHYFYWDTTVTIYSPGASRHATFNPAVSCIASTSDAPLTGNYITGLAGDLRYGTYGIDQIFYNAAPTNNPANPYSYQWCVIHNGTTGVLEGVLFATSPDGLNFSAYNGLTEVISRSVAGWDKMIGRMNTFIDSAGLWHAFYSGGLGTGGGEDSNFAGGLGYATSMNGITWTTLDKNPIIRKTEMFKSWKRLYCPWIVKDGAGNYTMYFSCKNSAGTYVVAIATLGGTI